MLVSLSLHTHSFMYSIQYISTYERTHMCGYRFSYVKKVLQLACPVAEQYYRIVHMMLSALVSVWHTKLKLQALTLRKERRNITYFGKSSFKIQISPPQTLLTLASCVSAAMDYTHPPPNGDLNGLLSNTVPSVADEALMSPKTKKKSGIKKLLAKCTPKVSTYVVYKKAFCIPVMHLEHVAVTRSTVYCN